MYKVTLMFFILFLSGCRNDHSDELYAFEQELNKDAEKRIDAAYLEITAHCDSLFTYELPLMVDSIWKTDSLK